MRCCFVAYFEGNWSPHSSATSLVPSTKTLKPVEYHPFCLTASHKHSPLPLSHSFLHPRPSYGANSVKLRILFPGQFLETFEFPSLPFLFHVILRIYMYFSADHFLDTSGNLIIQFGSEMKGKQLNLTRHVLKRDTWTTRPTTNTERFFLTSRNFTVLFGKCEDAWWWISWTPANPHSLFKYSRKHFSNP